MLESIPFCIYLFLYLQATPATACPATSLLGSRQVVVKPEVQRSHAAGLQVTQQEACLGTLQNVMVHPPIFPHSEAGLTFPGGHHFPRGSTLFLGGDPGQGSGRLAASGQNMNLAGKEVSILVLGIGSDSAVWRMDPPGNSQGSAQRGWRWLGTQCVLCPPWPPHMALTSHAPCSSVCWDEMAHPACLVICKIAPKCVPGPDLGTLYRAGLSSRLPSSKGFVLRPELAM